MEATKGEELNIERILGGVALIAVALTLPGCHFARKRLRTKRDPRPFAAISWSEGWV